MESGWAANVARHPVHRLPKCIALLAVTLTSIKAHALTAEEGHFARANDIVVDGRPNEAAWRAAPPVTRFFETYPGNIAAPGVRTEARFLYDDKYVYVAVSAFDPDPASVRTGLVRRDNITLDQDYVEVMLDPLGAGRHAFLFRTNPSGARNDGLYSEDEQRQDLRPDLDFDVAANVDATGWQAEFRIPLSTLRYRAGPDQSWRFVVSRNRPRAIRTTIQSSPQPRKATCTLCFAGTVRGISIAESVSPLYVTPQVTYAHREADDTVRGSLDAKWVPSPATVVDLTLWPDFSQVEADDLQLNANAQFTLALKEKRPFFLEATDLFTMPILALYTRSFAEPQMGARITHRGESGDYSALLLRDRGGTLLEPGTVSSLTLENPFDSVAAVGRYKRDIDEFSWGLLASARSNDGARGGENLVYGVDGTWSPTNTNRFSGQFLASTTSNPDVPELLPSWDGRRLAGTAYALDWQHASDRWFMTLAHSRYSDEFRAWNGFVPQVGVSLTSATGGLLFYPKSTVMMRISPGFIYSNSRALAGGEMGGDFSPSLSVSLPYSTELMVSWSPEASNTTFAGTRTYHYWSVTLATTPVAWMPGATVSALLGEGIDFATATVNKSKYIEASVPLRLFDRLELTSLVGYQAQDSREDGKRLFAQRNVQLDALWHFSSKFYLRGLYQNSHFDLATSTGSPALSTQSETFSALLSYEANWQTRCFVGLRRTKSDQTLPGSSGTEVFAKVSYLFAR